MQCQAPPVKLNTKEVSVLIVKSVQFSAVSPSQWETETNIYAGSPIMDIIRLSAARFY